MIKRIVVSTLLLSAFFALAGQQVHALAGWNAGRIIDDAVFTNVNTMNSGQIQNFLNSKVSSCDTNGTQPASDFGRSDLTHAQYAAMKGWQAPPYTCLRNYSENGLSAAQIISNISQKYQINPQVFVVLLQKEQGLVTDIWPLNSQYKTATGYGCPDTAPCDSQYFGLTNQLDWSGKMFRAIMNTSPTWYTPYILGNNYIQYSPTASCGGSTVNIQNRATQALYNYTPYQPNQAALDAGYGTVNCGAYGNRNFFLYFRDWFGPPTGVSYSWEASSFGIYSDSDYTNRIDTDGTFYTAPGQKVYVRVWAHNTGVSVWSGNTLALGTRDTNPVLRDASWRSRDRATLLNESSVSYDGTGTFNFAITSPSGYGNYYQNYSLVIDGVSWLSGPGLTILNKVAAQTVLPTATDNTISSESAMTPGQTIYSPDKSSLLRFDNGQVSLFPNLQYRWGTNSAGSGATTLVNQSDGNLVLYKSGGQAVWASNTAGKGPSTLSLENGGNLVLKDAGGTQIWSSNTGSPSDPSYRTNDTMGYDYFLFDNQTASSLDRRYKLTLQSDGNLVLYGPNRAIWASNTVGSGANRFTLQPDGNLVLYTAQDKPVWSSRTNGRGPSALVVQMDGNLVLYGPSGATWASNTSGRQ